jgi:RIP homotypic interaction motif
VKAEETPPAIEVNGGQGVQVGSGNVMHNTWTPKPPPDLAALSALNPHVAVARLQRLSREDLVDLFARASPDDATDVLAAFVVADEDTVVGILGDISLRYSALMGG